MFLLVSLLSFRAFANVDLIEKHREPLTPVSVQLNWHHQFEFAGFYAALQQGYFKEQGLEVTLKSWQPGISPEEEVSERRADFGVAYSSAVVDFITGAPIKLAFANFQISPMVLLSKSPVQQLEDLSGKTVMSHGSVDIEALIGQANQRVDIPLKSIPSTGNLQDFIDGRVDLYAAYQTNEPYRLKAQGIPFYTLDPKTYGVQSLGDVVITHKDLAKEKPYVVSAFKKATIQGWKFAFENPEMVVDFILEHYSVKKDRAALLDEAKLIKNFVAPDVSMIGEIDLGKVKTAALNARNVGWITHQQYKSFNPQDLVCQAQSVDLTSAEITYLKKHSKIQIGNDSFWEPFEFINPQGDFSGMSADYFALMEKRLGVKFEHYLHKPWSDVIEAAKSGEAKILSCAVATPERQEYMNFTEPYLSFPLVLVARKEVNFIDDYAMLNGQTVAVPKGYWSEEWLKNNYPEISLLPVNDVRQGLEAVLRGEAQAFSGNLASINFAIKRYGINGLHIVGDGGARFELAIGVNKDDDILLSIMKKALASITPAERDAIYNKWIQLELIRKTDHTTLILTVIGFLSVLSIFVGLIWLLLRQKKRQAFYINQFNELSMATYTNLKTGNIEWASDSFLALTGCSKEVVLGHSHFVFLHPDADPKEFQQLYDQVKQGHGFKKEIKARGCHGQDYWVELTASPEIKHGEVVGAWLTRVNITDKKRLEEVAIRDALTGVYNRHQFNELFGSLLHQSQRKAKPFAICMFDIDYFKSVNDQFGHQQGDQVLIQVAELAKQKFSRANDFIFRIGGEEFVVISDFDHCSEFESFLKKFKEAVVGLSIENPASEHKVVTISLGGLFISPVPKALTSSRVYSELDNLMYEAKSSGRNRVSFEEIRHTDDL